MKIDSIKKTISKFPTTPGVYIFKSKRRKAKGASKILYIGKATSLRDRVRSYFNQDIVNTRGPLITKMLDGFNAVEYIKTDSVLEALVLEAHLIKKYQPEANVKEKDNKSFNYVVITKDLPALPRVLGREQVGDYPRVLIVRGRDLQNYTGLPYVVAHSFGPFPNGSQLKEAMKIVRKMFPFRDKCEPRPRVPLGQNKPCFNRQIGLCPGVCTGEISKVDYAKQIKNIVLFLQGNKKRLISSLNTQMKDLAKKKEFEKANLIKHTLFTLNHIQDVSLIKDDVKKNRISDGEVFRIESYDIAHMSGQNVVGVMTVLENGEPQKSEYRKFKIRENPGVDDTKALKEVITRRLAHIEWRFPDLVVVDGGRAQKNVVERILGANDVKIPVDYGG